MGNKRWLLAALAAVLVASAPAVLCAGEEEHKAPAYLVVHWDQVEPSKAMEHETNAKAWVEAFAAKNMGPEWTWHAYSRPDFTYVYVFSMPDYAFLDGAPEREKLMAETLGEEKVAELMKGIDTVRTHHVEIMKAAPELSYSPETPLSKNPKFFRLGIHTVKPSMKKQFDELIKKVIGIFEKEKAPVQFTAYEVQFGAGTYHFVTGADSAVQFYSQPGTMAILNEAVGPEAAREMFRQWRDCIVDYQTSDWSFRPDLSYRPGMEPGEHAGAEKERK